MRFNPEEYITVHERIEKFYAKHPQGRIITAVAEHDRESGFILMRAEAYREPDDAMPAATGHAYELRSAGHVQAGSYVEVCETSAVGRALAMLGFEVQRGVASREEVVRAGAKASAAETPSAVPPVGIAPPKPRNPRVGGQRPAPAEGQVARMTTLAEECGVKLEDAITKTFNGAALSAVELNGDAVAYMIELLRRKKKARGVTHETTAE